MDAIEKEKGGDRAKARRQRSTAPEDDQRTLRVTVPDRVYKILHANRVLRNKSLSQLTTEALQHYLETEEGEDLAKARAETEEATTS